MLLGGWWVAAEKGRGKDGGKTMPPEGKRGVLGCVCVGGGVWFGVCVLGGTMRIRHVA